MTGFNPQTRRIVEERSGGMCEICGDKPVSEIHHRRPRGSGGSRDPVTDSVVNALGLCRDCHRLCESHRTVARMMGWLVTQSADPATVLVIRRGEPCHLDRDGGVW